MAQILYFLLLKPLSILPLSVLYLFSDVFYGVAVAGIAYRKRIVKSNLEMAFPRKTQKERNQICRKFYRHFYDLLAESIKLFSISEEEAIRRFKVTNPELFDELAKEGKSVILTGGHYQNWELFAVATNPQIKHQLLGIYTPLTNPFFEKKFYESRSKFGLQLVPKKEVKTYFEKFKNQLIVTTFAIDQSPRKNQKALWMEFLGQETAVHFGAEKYAKTYNHTVIFGKAKKVKRGCYELTFEILVIQPEKSAEREITQLATRQLENQIIELPEYWLWTHKRWKLKRESIKKELATASS